MDLLFAAGKCVPYPQCTDARVNIAEELAITISNHKKTNEDFMGPRRLSLIS